ncbi:hypothetical protein D3C72_1380900 [compost metagenome]
MSAWPSRACASRRFSVPRKICMALWWRMACAPFMPLAARRPDLVMARRMAMAAPLYFRARSLAGRPFTFDAISRNQTVSILAACALPLRAASMAASSGRRGMM